MKRKDKEITDRMEIESILSQARICRIGFSQNNKPYIVPMNFGYKDGYLFFHCAQEGMKIDIIKQNNNVCFEVDINHEITDTGILCNWSTRYSSVIGFGKALLVKDPIEKKLALNVIVNHYSPKAKFKYSEEALNKVGIIKIEITSMTGKKSE